MKINCAHDELLELHKIIPNPKNPNKHPQDQIDRLSKLLDYQGQRHPIIVSNRSGFVVVGHGRLEAIKKLGWEKAAVNYQDFNDEAQEYAFIVSDNAIAEWADLDLSEINKEMLDLGPDFEIEMLGLKDFTIEPIEKFDPLTDEDEIPEVIHPITRKGDIWLLGNHRLMCGDSTMIDDVEKLMNGEKADMVFTDPPYGINLKIGDGNGNGLAKKTDYHYIKNDNSIKCAVDVINLVNGLGVRKQLYWGANYFLTALGNTKCFICWDKRGDLPADDFCGTEIAWTNCEIHTKTIKVAWKGMIKEGENEKRLHPNQKPLLLIEKCFEYLKAENLILDLFLGSGSTLIACEKTNRKCYGMELDEKYCDIIVNRWQNFTGKKATLELTGQIYEELKLERGDK